MTDAETRFARDCSPFLDRLIDRHPDWLEALEAGDRLTGDSPPDPDALQAGIGDHGLDPGLRRFRNREMMRIVWRELTGAATLEATMADLSRLAEVCLDAAIAYHTEALTGRFGPPLNHDGEPQRLVVLGLGKLGGGELNLSSDIDVIFCHPENGACDGRRGLANESFFTRLVRAVIRSLSELTEDGFCFRVDARLRPFGESGPLSCSFDAMEQYYQREGRDWERYALVKARPVAGDRTAGELLLKRLQPFVYRRYIDYGSVEALQDMLGMIRADAARAGRENDIKRGPGGIREIEFLAQCVQLLRGGREPSLRTQGLLQALDAIEALDLMPADRVASLRDDYRFLRRLENAIQALHDRQTHVLPEGEDLERVTRALRFDDAQALLAQLETTRVRVNGALADSFPRDRTPPDGEAAAGWEDALDNAGKLTPALLSAFHDRLAGQTLSRRAVTRLDHFMPLLMQRLQARQPDDEALEDIFGLVQTIGRRSAYLSLLVQNPGALDRMLDLFTRSRWLAQVVIQHPALLDELIDPSLGARLPDRDDLRALVQRAVRSDNDTESAINGLNYVKQSQSLRIAAAELDGTLDAVQAEQRLTELAEVLIDGTLAVSAAHMRRRHGELAPPGLAVIGYGSLGGGAMAYGSDLDLVFLYGRADGESDGERPLAAETWFTRLTRRMLSLITTMTPGGRLYEVDTRLRPNGRAGLLVSSLSAFSKYQSRHAWTWELQALVRARPVAGDTDVAAGFAETRAAVLARTRDPDATRRDVVDMRRRMRRELDGGEHLKHGPGGLVDIDFVAQLGVLLCAHEHPALLARRDSGSLLLELGEIGWLEADDAAVLQQTREALVRTRHLADLGRGAPPPLPDMAPAAGICGRVLSGS